MSQSDQGGAGRREVAWRVFADEYDDATFSHSESDEERAPNYVVTPTGARINRLFVVGVLTEVEQVSDDVLRARVVDPTGAFVIYAGQYQPDEMAFLENASPPAFVAVTGKARTFQPEDSDRVFTSIRPESINRVDADTRDRWVVQTAQQTLARTSTFADALDSGKYGDELRQALEAGGTDAGLAAGIPLALDHYGTTKGYLAAVWDLAVDAARVVAGEIDADEVGPLDLAPDSGGDEVDVDLDYSLTEAGTGEIGDLETGVETEAGVEADAEAEAAAGEEMTPESDTPPAESRTEVDETDAVPEGSAEPEPTESVESEPDLGEAPETEADPAAGTDSEPGIGAESESGTEPETGIEAESDTDTAPSDGLGAAPTSSVDDSDESEAPEIENAEEAAELQDEIGDDAPPTVEPEQETSTEESFEPETDVDEEVGTGGAGDEMYEFDEEEREQIEEEHGLEFSTGTEVDDPSESDFEPPEPEAESQSETEQGPDEQTPEREAELADAEPEPESAAEPTAEEVDTDRLQDVESAEGGTEDVVNTDEQAPQGAESAAAEAPGASIGEDEVAEPDDGEADTSETEEPENLEDTVMDTMRDLNDGDGVERETLMAAVVQDYDVTPADVEDALEAALMSGRCYESGEDTLKPI